MRLMVVRKFIFDFLINKIPVSKLKIWYLKIFYKWEIGKGTKIWNNILLDGDTYQKVIIGDNCEVARGVFFNTNWDGKIIIGDNVVFGHDVYLYGIDHDPSDLNFSVRAGKIEIKNNCWIASKASILKGVTVGEHSVIAYGSVVTKNIPEYVIAGGVPACVIKKRVYKNDA